MYLNSTTVSVLGLKVNSDRYSWFVEANVFCDILASTIKSNSGLAYITPLELISMD